MPAMIQAKVAGAVKYRIIYDRQDAAQIIAIEKIKPRGDAYK